MPSHRPNRLSSFEASSRSMPLKPARYVLIACPTVMVTRRQPSALLSTPDVVRSWWPFGGQVFLASDLREPTDERLLLRALRARARIDDHCIRLLWVHPEAEEHTLGDRASPPHPGGAVDE